MVGIEHRQFTVVHRLAQGVEARNRLHQIELFFCILCSSQLGIDISEGRSVSGQRDGSHRLLVQSSGFGVAVLRRLYLCLEGQGAMVSGEQRG